MVPEGGTHTPNPRAPNPRALPSMATSKRGSLPCILVGELPEYAALVGGVCACLASSDAVRNDRVDQRKNPAHSAVAVLAVRPGPSPSAISERARP